MLVEIKKGEPTEVELDNTNLGTKVRVMEDAFVLIPNKEHENFTTTDKVIKAGTTLYGKESLIKGKRRGEPFTYRLFLTTNDELIHLKKVKPMRTTEVTLGADSQQTPTLVEIPSTKKFLTKNLVIASLVGAAAGFLYSKKYKGHDKKKVAMFTIGGAVLGFVAGKYYEHRKGIVIKKSK
jgi:hypothetical protein